MKSMERFLEIVKAPLVRRLAVLAVGICISAGIITGALVFSSRDDWETIKDRLKGGFKWGQNWEAVPTCLSVENYGSRGIWDNANERYRDLKDDKFTVAIQTYDRPKELAETLKVLGSFEVKSLQEIVVVWNNIDQDPPDDYFAENGAPVRYRRSKVNSLNQKLIADPAYQTKAILLSDDDVYYHPSDLEFVFQTWRKFGQYRLTGALPRCAEKGSDGHWKYTFCSDEHGKDAYSLIITNLAFAHIAFLDYYSSNDTIMHNVRKYVDEHMNCEDIATNFVSSLVTRSGPLLVTGYERYVNFNPGAGISRKPGHIDARSQCLDDLSKMFGCMPLMDETAYIQRGVVVL